MPSKQLQCVKNAHGPPNDGVAAETCPAEIWRTEAIPRCNLSTGATTVGDAMSALGINILRVMLVLRERVLLLMIIATESRIRGGNYRTLREVV